MLNALPHFEVIPVCDPEDLPADGIRAVLTKDRQDEAALCALSAAMGERLCVQEVWKELLPQTTLLISSAICGGDIRTRFSQAAAERSCCLLLEPIRTRFSLPCPSGQGEPFSELPPKPHFYSEALCCYYAHKPPQLFLWDTEETLENKISLAGEAGFCGMSAK